MRDQLEVIAYINTETGENTYKVYSDTYYGYIEGEDISLSGAIAAFDANLAEAKKMSKSA